MASPMRRQDVQGGLQNLSTREAANPPEMEFISSSKVPFNTIHANNYEFYKELDHVIQKEPMDFLDPEFAASLPPSASSRERSSRPTSE